MRLYIKDVYSYCVSQISRLCFSMAYTEDIYLVCLSAFLLLFILYGLRKIIIPLSSSRRRLSSCSKRLYYLFLRYFSYPRPTWRLFGLSELSPLSMGLLFLYFLGTGACNFIGAQTVSERSTRAAHLSLINLLPLYLSGGPDVSARLLGISLDLSGGLRDYPPSSCLHGRASGRNSQWYSATRNRTGPIEVCGLLRPTGQFFSRLLCLGLLVFSTKAIIG